MNVGTQDDKIDTRALLEKISIEDEIGRVVELKRAGKELIGLCPFHGERTPSFAVIPAKQFFHCHGCGAAGDAIDFVMRYDRVGFREACRILGSDEGMQQREAPAPRAPPPPERITKTPPTDCAVPGMSSRRFGNPVRTWEYRAADGGLLGYVARYEFTDDGRKKKLTPQWTWGSTDGGKTWGWGMGHWNKPRPLYGLDRLAARPDAEVLICEGEKATESSGALRNYVNVGWPGGCQAVKHVDWTPMRGRRVILWPDADPPGIAAMHEVAAILLALGCTVRIIDPHGQSDGWDCADAIESGWSVERIVQWARVRIAAYVPQPAALAPATKEVMRSERGPELHASPGSPATPPPSNSPAGGDATECRSCGALLTRGERQSGQCADCTSGPERPAQLKPPISDRPPRGRPALAAVDGNTVRKPEPLPADLPPEYSDDAVAQQFTAAHGDTLRYVAAWGRWLEWTGQRWLHDETLRAPDLSRQICRDAAVHCFHNRNLTPSQQRTGAAKLASAKTCQNVISLARADARHAASTSQWDADPWALNTPAGIVDLQSGVLRPSRPDDHCSKITAVAAGGRCPTWLAFLHTATGGDMDLQRFLQRVAGYSLTGVIREHALFFFHGGGGNGKGTFLNTLQYVMGDYSRVASINTFTETKQQQHSTELARMHGSRLVTAQETGEGKRWDEEKIKTLTGGDRITARFLFKDDFTFDPTWKVIVAGNNKPLIRTVDDAMRRRLHLIPFTLKPKEVDVQLADKLKMEAAGILQWALDGCIAWLRTGLDAPESVRTATNAYLSEQDSMQSWIDERCDLTTEGGSSGGLLFDDFRKWSEKRDDPSISAVRFAGRLESKGYRKTKNSSGLMIFHGITLRHDQLSARNGPMFADEENT